MGTALLWLGRAGGLAGLLLSLGAILLRARGVYNFAGFQIGTLLLAGIAAMVAGCLGYLAALVERPRQ